MQDKTPTSPTNISFSEAVQYWLKLGFISFGGPAGQIAIMHQDLVERRQWISEQQFMHALNFCMLLPGPEAQQLAIYIGWLMHGKWGGIVAGTLFILPALLLMWLLGYSYMLYGSLPMAQSLLWGIKPAVVALVLFAAYRIAKKTLHHRALKIIALAALVAVGVAQIAFPWVILLAALLGWCLRHRLHQAVDLSALAVSKQAQPLRTSLLRTLLVSSAIFVLAIGVLTWQFGAQSILVNSAWFYSKCALLTFGGAYAVLPYIADALVQQLQWLSPAQMMDGLALGETTPGPLIMVISFVSFVAGWNQAILSPNEGTQALLWAGLLSSSVATFFTFFPSYVMVLLGAPLIQASGQQIHLKAPLSAISAAVVGVIVNLALYFAKDVFLQAQSVASDPNVVSWHIDFAALALSVLSFMLLKKHQASPLLVILACAGFGVLHAWI